LPRHSTVIIWPGARDEISASTGAPAACAFADGAKELTKGTAVATPATPPTAQAVVTQRRREGSGGRFGSTAPESSSCVVISLSLVSLFCPAGHGLFTIFGYVQSFQPRIIALARIAGVM